MHGMATGGGVRQRDRSGHHHQNKEETEISAGRDVYRVGRVSNSMYRSRSSAGRPSDGVCRHQKYTAMCNGACLHAAAFQYPSAICAARTAPGCYYIGDASTVRYCDGVTVSLVAGGQWGDYADGVGDGARFSGVRGMVCNGRTLFVSDRGNNRIRSIDVATQSVTTACGNGANQNCDGVGTSTAALDYMNQLCFDRGASPPPASAIGGGGDDSVLWIATGPGGLRRFDSKTRMYQRWVMATDERMCEGAKVVTSIY